MIHSVEFNFFVVQPPGESIVHNIIDDANRLLEFSQLDVLASSVFIGLNIFSWIFYFFAFKFQVKDLNNFCKEVEEFNKENESFNKKLMKTKGN